MATPMAMRPWPWTWWWTDVVVVDDDRYNSSMTIRYRYKSTKSEHNASLYYSWVLQSYYLLYVLPNALKRTSVFSPTVGILTVWSGTDTDSRQTDETGSSNGVDEVGATRVSDINHVLPVYTLDFVVCAQHSRNLKLFSQPRQAT